MEKFRHHLEKCTRRKLWCYQCGRRTGAAVLAIVTLMVGLMYGALGFVNCGGFGIFNMAVGWAYIMAGMLLGISLFPHNWARFLELCFAWMMFLLIFCPLVSLVLLLLERDCIIAHYSKHLYLDSDAVLYVTAVLSAVAVIWFNIDWARYILWSPEDSPSLADDSVEYNNEQ